MRLYYLYLITIALSVSFVLLLFFIEYRYILFLKTPFYFYIIPGIIAISYGIIIAKLIIINKELKYFSTHDLLTSIKNRRSIADIIEVEFNRSKRYGSYFSIIIVDIDNFKSINDNYGHHVGDHVLNHFGSFIKKQIRSTDDCGRWGGEEFVIFLPQTDLKSGIIKANQIRESVEKKSFHRDLKVVTISLGVASLTSEDKVYQDMVQRADDALYEAKRQGKNRVAPSP